MRLVRCTFCCWYGPRKGSSLVSQVMTKKSTNKTPRRVRVISSKKGETMADVATVRNTCSSSSMLFTFFTNHF
jgi:predicted Zn-dependent protease